VARPLLSLRLQLCASPEYLQRQGTPQSPQDLLRHNCLYAPSATQDGVWHFLRGDERAEVTVRGSLQSDAVDALYDLVLAGAGITLLSDDIAAKHILAGRLQPLLADWEIEPGVKLYAVYLPTRHLAPKVRVFIDFLVERLGTAPPHQPSVARL
jgi:DNA-binding transcriptional LysR family regulator